jgi:hypothetical protein
VVIVVEKKRATGRTRFVSMNVTVPARDTLQDQTFVLTGKLRRRVSLSEVVLAAARLTERYPEEFEAIVSGDHDHDGEREPSHEPA